MNLSLIEGPMSRNSKIFVMLTVIIILLFAINGIVNPASLRPRNIMEVVRQSAPLAITAMGQAAVILSGGIDLTVGEIITMTNILSTDMIRGDNLRTIPVVIFLLFLGLLIGAANGFLISITRIPPLVVTFAMSSIVRGGYLLYSGGAPRGRASPLLRYLGIGRLFGIPFSIIFLLIMTGIVLFVFYKTKWGRSVSFLGNNPTAAEYVGIPKNFRLIMIYAFSSFMAVIAGLILTGYIGVGNFDVGGDPYMLESIASPVIGGITFSGLGNIAGAPIGALIMTVIGSVMISLGVAETGQLILRGAIIVFMVALYMGELSLKKIKKILIKPQ